MQKSPDLAGALARFEIVEWLYDGLGGKIIKWTKEHGNTNDDPSVLAFVVTAGGEVVARAPDAAPYQASSFAKWLAEQAVAYERDHPRTAVPFVCAEVAVDGEQATCAVADAALAAGKPILAYFAREPRAGDGTPEKKECSDARAFEKKTLGAKSAAEAAAAVEGLVLLRFDLADAAHAKLAAKHEVAKGPVLLLFTPGAETPENLGGKLDGGSLAFRLKKLAKPATPAAR